MYITYHKEISLKGENLYVFSSNLFPHNALDERIRHYIETKKSYQEEYLVSYNGYYLFIYLLNGDRIDVSF